MRILEKILMRLCKPRWFSRRRRCISNKDKNTIEEVMIEDKGRRNEPVKLELTRIRKKLRWQKKTNSI
jgi:hypothetical protein